MAVQVYQEPNATCSPAVKAIVEDIMPEVPGAVVPLVEQAVLRAYKEFFQKTKVWVRKLGPYDIRANSPTIKLDQVDAYKLVGYPLQVWLYDNDEGEGIRVIPSLSRWNSYILNGTINGGPTGYYCENPGELKLYPLSSVTMPNSVIVYASTYPIHKEFEIPSWLLERYFEAYRSGALRNILVQPSKPYTDPKMAQYYGQVFLKGVTTGLADFRKNWQPNGLSWRYPKWA